MRWSITSPTSAARGRCRGRRWIQNCGGGSAGSRSPWRSSARRSPCGPTSRPRSSIACFSAGPTIPPARGSSRSRSPGKASTRRRGRRRVSPVRLAGRSVSRSASLVRHRKSSGSGSRRWRTEARRRSISSRMPRRSRRPTPRDCRGLRSRWTCRCSRATPGRNRCGCGRSRRRWSISRLRSRRRPMRAAASNGRHRVPVR